MVPDTMRRLWRDESGNSSLEFVVWLPLFTFLLMFTANAGFIYLDLAKMENAARDGARRLSIGESAATVTTEVAAQLPNSEYYTIDVSCTTADVVCIRISRPSEDMLPFANFMGVGNLLGQTWGSEIRMNREPS